MKDDIREKAARIPRNARVILTIQRGEEKPTVLIGRFQRVSNGHIVMIGKHQRTESRWPLTAVKDIEEEKR